MDQHVHSLAEAVIATSVEGAENSLIVPIIDLLDEVASFSTSDPLLRRKCSLALGRVCSSRGILPARYPSASDLIVLGDCPSDQGGSAEIRRGEVEGCPVAVKAIRRYSTVSMIRDQEQFYQEILIWGRLSHPNILPLFWVDTNTFPLAAVSPWMQHGNLRGYLIHFPNASRLKLLLDASRGLEYMHGLDYVHGDLMSLNVLIDDNHSARLADFGSSSLLPLLGPDGSMWPAPMGDNGFSIRWLAPELVHPEEFGFNVRVCSKESDIYSFSMLMYEAFSGLFPFDGYRDETVVLSVVSGARPKRPRGSLGLGLTDGIWKMMQECWGSSDRRWKISCVVSRLESSIAATVRAARPDERAAARRPAFTPVPSSASPPESETRATRPSSGRTVFRKLDQLFRP